MAEEEEAAPDFIIGSVRVGDLKGPPVSGSKEMRCDRCGHMVHVSPGSQQVLQESAAEGKKVEIRCADYCIQEVHDDPESGAVLSQKEFMRVVRGEAIDPDRISDMPFVVRDSKGREVVLAVSTVKGKPLVMLNMREIMHEGGSEVGITMVLDGHDLVQLVQSLLDKTEEVGRRLRSSS